MYKTLTYSLSNSRLSVWILSFYVSEVINLGEIVFTLTFSLAIIFKSNLILIYHTGGIPERSSRYTSERFRREKYSSHEYFRDLEYE